MLNNHSSIKFLMLSSLQIGFLRNVARSADLACMPQRFIYILGKIDDKKDQGKAVENGVCALVDAKRLNALILFSAALKEGTFLSNDLENVAIR